MPRSKQTPTTPTITPKKGRPKNSGLKVPHWAHQAVARLSTHSGVSSQKILEVALRDGLQLVSEPLGAWVNYQQTAEKQWNEHLEPPAPAGEGQHEAAESPDTATDAGRSLQPEPERGDIEGLDLHDEQSRHGAEAFAANGSLEGE